MSLRIFGAISALLAVFLAGSASFAGPGGDTTPLPTSVANYFIRGTQPNEMVDYIESPDTCGACHGGSPNNRYDWDGSLKAQAARDPLFYAALDIAEHDAPGIGDTCLRCHAPQGWLEGRATPTDGSGLDFGDRKGVSCSICHRQVDPFNGPGSPSIDLPILAALGANAPVQSIDLLGNPGGTGNGALVIDPLNRIRGPFPVGANPPGQNPPPEVSCNFFHNAFLGQSAYESSLFRKSEACAACHDVSTPHFIYNTTGGTFDFNFAEPSTIEPNSNKYHMFPQQRTYSEWLRSAFADSGVDMQGRFGGGAPGTQTIISECMDCHMPKAEGFMCDFTPVFRDDIRQHFFSGAATWVLDAIARYYGPEFLGELSFDEVFAIAENILRNQKMLKCAADLDVTVEQSEPPGAPQLRVRVTNQTGHKLPTGFPEGRRMWINVEFYNDCADPGVPVEVLGGYDEITNTLDASTTKVYEAKIGPSSALAPSVNLPAGPSFHVALSNTMYKDNRIPPRGFTNAAYTAVNAAPIDANYADGQYWDDTLFPIPPNTTGVRVRLFYEAASREFIEFLRDKNPNATDPDNRGQLAYNLWHNNGATPQPELMAVFPPTEAFDDGLPPCTLPDRDVDAIDPDGDGIYSLLVPGDINGDLVVDDADIAAYVDAMMNESQDPILLCIADYEPDGVINGADLQGFVDMLIGP